MMQERLTESFSSNPEPLPWETKEYLETNDPEKKADSKCRECSKNEREENSYLCKGCKEGYIVKQGNLRIRSARDLSLEELKIMQTKLLEMGKQNKFFNDVNKIFSPVSPAQMGLQTT
jgi:hypothetical protein